MSKRVVVVRVFVKKTEKTPRDRTCLVAGRVGFVGVARKMARISELHKKWMKKSGYRKAYEALEEEFALASALIEVRKRTGLTQDELAQRMGTTQPVVARLESGRTRPSMRTLERLAKATGSRLLIQFKPLAAKKPAG